MVKQKVRFEDLGIRSYQAAWDYQEELMAANLSLKAKSFGKPEQDQPSLPDTRHHLLFVEHPAVYTLGKSGKMEHVLLSPEEREKRQIEFFKTNRGGDITFHGPGQLVGYPIFDLEKFKTDIGWYMRSIEEVIIRCMADYGLAGSRSAGETGVWLDPGHPGRARKICALGVRCSRWITMHGFALNINTDLNYFNFIIPCGIANKQVTSLEKELGFRLPEEEVKEKVRHYFKEVFDFEFLPAA